MNARTRLMVGAMTVVIWGLLAAWCFADDQSALGAVCLALMAFRAVQWGRQYRYFNDDGSGPA